MGSLENLREKVKKYSNSEKAKFLQGFFKTGEGQYGYGDIFLGITVPNLRKISIQFPNLSLQEIQILLKSKFHEERLLALLLLVNQFKKAKGESKLNYFKFYLKNAKNINNWDLVDASADKIVGEYILDKDRSILLKLAKSENLWERRIAIIATYSFIKKGEFKDTFKIAEVLLNDKEDLIQKAVGWMLREVGKKSSKEVLSGFLKIHYQKMPRTMLRYSIEHFSPKVRLRYLKSQI